MGITSKPVIRPQSQRDLPISLNAAVSLDSLGGGDYIPSSSRRAIRGETTRSLQGTLDMLILKAAILQTKPERL